MSSGRPKSKKPAGKKAERTPPRQPGQRTGTPPKPARARSTAPRSQQPVVLLSGETSTALEYAAAFAARSYTVELWDCEPTPDRASLPAGVRVVAQPSAPAIAVDVTNLDAARKRRRLELVDATLPPDTVILSSSLTVGATEQASWLTHRHRLVGFAGLPTFSGAALAETAPTVFTPPATLEAVRTFWRSIGKEMELVQDRTGLVAARIVCQIINEAMFALQDNVGRPEDIDTAMQLGVSYPHGPFAWADRIGVDHVVAVLDALYREYHEERYRTAPLLRQMALAGPWWKRPSSNPGAA